MFYTRFIADKSALQLNVRPFHLQTLIKLGPSKNAIRHSNNNYISLKTFTSISFKKFKKNLLTQDIGMIDLGIRYK